MRKYLEIFYLRKKNIRFNYNRYEIDKKLHSNKIHTASPYQLILNNQRYYLYDCFRVNLRISSM